MAAWGAPGVPGGPEPTAPGTTGTVKAAVGLTMLTIALALGEAVFAVYMRQRLPHTDNMSGDELLGFSLMLGSLIGSNLIVSAGLAGGAILTLRRRVAGKVLIWVFGSLSTLLRCGCGGMAGLFVYIYGIAKENNDSPFSTGLWGALLAIEVAGLAAILLAMVLLMLKSASFKNPQPPAGSGTGYRDPYGSPAARADGLPDLPPAPGWPT
jgi:hypothetical protein